MPKEIGDNTPYPTEIREKILYYIRKGYSLRKIEKMEDMPATTTIHEWLAEDKAWAEQYAQAKEQQAEHFVDEAMDNLHTMMDKAQNDEVSNSYVQANKVFLEGMKWAAEINKPKKYSTLAIEEAKRLSINCVDLSDKSFYERYEHFTNQFLRGELLESQYLALVRGMGNYEQNKLIEEAEKIINKKSQDKDKGK